MRNFYVRRFHRFCLQDDELVGDFSSQRFVESVVEKCELEVSRQFGLPHVKVLQQQLGFASDVMRLEELRYVCALCQLQPISAAWMTLNKVYKVVELIMHPP